MKVTLRLGAFTGLFAMGVLAVSSEPIDTNSVPMRSESGLTHFELEGAVSTERGRWPVGLRRAATFEDFHGRQQQAFASVPSAFGNARMIEMEFATRLNHSSSGEFGLLELWESEFDAEIFDVGPGARDHEANGLDSMTDGSNALEFPGELLSIQSFNVAPFNEAVRSSEWKVSRMELIGLLKHEAPIAYVAGGVPRMEELNNVPTIPLNEFEQDSIAQLRSNPKQQIVVDHRVNRIQMVGALRAEEVCTQCHKVAVGELLGAFTYQFDLHRELSDLTDSPNLGWKAEFVADISRLQAAEEKPFARGGGIRRLTESAMRSPRKWNAAAAAIGIDRE